MQIGVDRCKCPEKGRHGKPPCGAVRTGSRGGVCISTIGDIQHRGLCERAPLCSVARGKIVTGT